jgi:hypothetical protein
MRRVPFRPESYPRYRHKKSGGEYEIITDSASLQCSAAPEFEKLFDEDCFTVYQNIATGAIYVRPTPEFFDGRFEQIDPAARNVYEKSE